MGDNEQTSITTQKVLQNAPDPQETLRASVEGGNAGEKFTYASGDFFTRLMQVI